MILRPLLILIALLLLYFGYRWIRRQPRHVKIQAMLIGFALFVGVMVVTGRAHWLLAPLAALLPFAVRLAGLLFQHLPTLYSLARLFGFRPPWQRDEGESTVESAFLRMKLDPNTGAIEGEVLRGRFAGRALSELTRQELLELFRECSDDPDSAGLLGAYLDRTQPGWRVRGEGDQSNARHPESGRMSESEARSILGVGSDAKRDEIVAAHRRLMQRIHPDRGGSDYLAAKVNRAKERLLE